MPNTRNAIRDHYDRNTKLFLAFNRTHRADNIHRSLWIDSTTTLEQALNVTNERIRAEIAAVAPTHARIADLGCGVGAGLMHIVPRLQSPQPALGLTLSPVQARLAGQFVKQINLDTNIGIAEGDFTSVPLATETLDAVYSVEAVVHAPEPERYFQEASRLLRRGGTLMLVDDYRAARALTPHETKWLEAYIQGWHVPSVTTVAQAVEFAGRLGLRLKKNEDFTPHLHLHTLPNPIANALLFLGHHLPMKHPILPSMLGSMALQQCLSLQVIEYRMLVFEKGPPS